MAEERFLETHIFTIFHATDVLSGNKSQCDWTLNECYHLIAPITALASWSKVLVMLLFCFEVSDCGHDELGVDIFIKRRIRRCRKFLGLRVKGEWIERSVDLALSEELTVVEVLI
jgi:hypothetical protein